MTPEYLYELADISDPDELWRLPAIEQLDLPFEKRVQLDTGIALRRHASHVNQLLDILANGKSMLITPLRPNFAAVDAISTPRPHQRLKRDYL